MAAGNGQPIFPADWCDRRQIRAISLHFGIADLFDLLQRAIGIVGQNLANGVKLRAERFLEVFCLRHGG